MKHLHMLMAVITITIYLYQAGMIFSGKSLAFGRVLKIATHIIYAVLMATGLYLLVILSKVAGVQHWAFAKIILMIMAVSANIKALKSTQLSQAKAGMLIAGVAYVGIIILAITKPNL